MGVQRFTERETEKKNNTNAMSVQKFELSNGCRLELVSENDAAVPLEKNSSGESVVDLAQFSGKIIIRDPHASEVTKHKKVATDSVTQDHVPNRIIPSRLNTTSEVTLDSYLMLAPDSKQNTEDLISNDHSPHLPHRKGSMAMAKSKNQSQKGIANKNDQISDHGQARSNAKDISPQPPERKLSRPGSSNLHDVLPEPPNLQRSEGSLDTNDLLDIVPVKPERQVTATKISIEGNHLSDSNESDHDLEEARDKVAPLDTQASLRLIESIRLDNALSEESSNEVNTIKSEGADTCDSTPKLPNRRKSLNDSMSSINSTATTKARVVIARPQLAGDEDMRLKRGTSFMLTNVKKHVTNLKERRRDIGVPSPTGIQLNPAHPAPTRLHKLVSQSKVSLEDLVKCLRDNPAAARTADANGRLPLHIIGDNTALLNSEEGRKVASAFCITLFHAFPPGITIADRSGYFPFVRLIDDWVVSVYQDYRKKALLRSASADSLLSSQTTFLSRLRTMISTRQLTDEMKLNNVHESRDSKEEHQTRVNFFLQSNRIWPQVYLWDEAQWAFEMLSAAIDELGGKHGSLHKSKRKVKSNPVALDNSSKTKLAQHLTSVIPILFRTVLLLEDDGEKTRDTLLRMSVFRRCLLCPGTIGPWICNMLRRKGVPSRRAVELMELVSRTTVVDFVGKYRTPLSPDYEAYEMTKEQVYLSVKTIDDLVPSLMTLESEDLRRAALTEVAWNLMCANLSRPFVVALVLIDLVLHVTLMMAFRNDVEIPREGGPTAVGNVPTQVVFVICAHYFIRIASETLALLNVSVKVARKYVSDIWNMFNTLAIILTLTATVWNDQNPGQYRSSFNAIVMGLLWLKVLGFLKVINKQMSTFILALTQILKDLRYFMVVMLVVLFMFGDMIYIVVSTKDNGRYCEVQGEAGALSSPVEDFCSNNQGDLYLRMYTLLLGDFELDDYKDPSGLTALFVIFTMFGVVILLNVLIAVVSDAYERASLSSKSLFGIARISFVAQNQALESFLKPGLRSYSYDYGIPTTRHRILSMVIRAFRWTVLLAIMLTAMSAELYLVTRAISLLRAGEAQVVTLFAICLLSGLLAVALWAIFTFAFERTWNSGEESRLPLVNRINRFCTNYFISFLSTRMFGLRTTISGGKPSEAEEWAGKIKHLEIVLGQRIDSATYELRTEILELEDRLKAVEQ